MKFGVTNPIRLGRGLELNRRNFSQSEPGFYFCSTSDPTSRYRASRVPPLGPEQKNTKSQVLHLVSLRNQKATLSLPQLYPGCTEPMTLNSAYIVVPSAEAPHLDGPVSIATLPDSLPIIHQCSFMTLHVPERRWLLNASCVYASGRRVLSRKGKLAHPS